MYYESFRKLSRIHLHWCVNSISVIPASEVGFDTAYFSAFQCSTERYVCTGEEPHFSDGTELGTYQLADLKSGSTNLLPLAGKCRGGYSGQ